MEPTKNESSSETPSCKGGVSVSSLGLSDLTEEELKYYNKEIRWYHNLGIAAPTKLIFNKIICLRQN